VQKILHNRERRQGEVQEHLHKERFSFGSPTHPIPARRASEGTSSRNTLACASGWYFGERFERLHSDSFPRLLPAIPFDKESPRRDQANIWLYCLAWIITIASDRPFDHLDLGFAYDQWR
jgi:hypothetical protein